MEWGGREKKKIEPVVFQFLSGRRKIGNSQENTIRSQPLIGHV